MTARRALLALAVLTVGCATARPTVSLQPISVRPRGDGLAALGLSGANKPNGIEHRLRQSVPPPTPAFVPRALDGLELWIADPVPGGGWLAFYRGPLELRPRAENARFRALLLSPRGERRWDLPLNPLLSRPDQLEIQDIRLHEGELYLNEACQTYSREAGGECSALVRVDPEQGRVVWRTRPRVSNDILIVHGEHVVAGYGFTAEPDSLFLVSRRTGEIRARHPLDSAHAYLEVADGRLVVVTRGRVYTFPLPPAGR